jgi:hypothetical protein
MNAGILWRRRLAGGFRYRDSMQNCRRDAGATKTASVAVNYKLIVLLT